MFKKTIISIVSVVWALFAIAQNENQLITIPHIINFQGKLTDVGGNPVSDSIYSITFRFFPTPTGGTSFWGETQSVQTNNGIFNCLLGSVIPIGYIPTDGNCYLEMQVNPNPAMTPRIRIVSSAYAFYSQKSDSANYALNATITRPISPPITTEEISNNAVNSLKILDGTISRADVAADFKAPFADTADYVRNINVNYVDSAGVAVNAYNADKLQGKDTIALSNKFVDEGQVNAITNPMIVDDAITSAKIQDGTILRQDVAADFKAPFADTADYACGAPLARPITPPIATEEISDDAVTSDKIKDGAIRGNDISTPITLSNAVSYPNAILNIKNTGSGRGILIDTAGFGALAVNYSFTDGVNIGYALQSGVYVDTAGGDGVFVSNAGIDGIGINNAGWDGLYVMNSGINGVEIFDAASDGMYVINVGNNGVTIDNAENYGVSAYGNVAGGEFSAANQSATGLIVHSYQNAANDTAIQAYGAGFATGGWYTSSLFDNKSAPCLISPELGIITAGTGMLINGKATINFDPLFVENVRLDVPIRINVTPKAKPAGLIYVTESKATGFTVELEPIPGLEKNQFDITFDWIAFGTLKNPETSNSAQAQWQKMVKERETRQTEAKLRNQKRQDFRRQSQK
ncbi:MAG: hypothetical protein ABIK33_01935 [candidate division WOR-3 bacterium]